MIPDYILLLFIGGLSLTVGDLFAGKYIKNKGKMLYLTVMLFYIIGLTFLIFSYKSTNIAVASVILEVFNVATLTIIGKFLFKETITKYELCGIALGVIAIIIL
jgi:multidrug transporter EmrE-like cation transporter